MPERSDALKKAQQKYMERFSVARVRMERDQYERVQAHAEAQGESVNGFINRAIDNQIARDGHKGPCEAQQAQPGDGVVYLFKAAQEASEAAGEGVEVFIGRAVSVQAKRDEAARKLVKLEKEV